MADKEHFFSKANLNRAAWSLLIALIGFLAGCMYSYFKGKEKVVIATPDEGAKPLIVRVQRPPDDPEFRSLTKIDELKDEIRRLREVQANSTSRPASGLDSRKTSSSRINPPFIPAFQLPPSVKGYYRTSLSAFGEASCPPHDVTIGDVLILQLFLQPTVNVSELTPAFLQLDRPEGKDKTIQVFEQQYVLANGMNSFRIALEIQPGVYNVSFGFYARAELTREYPNFYSIYCNMTVH